MDGVTCAWSDSTCLRLNTMPALDVSRLDDAGALSRMTASELRELGASHIHGPPQGRKRFYPGELDRAIDLIAARLSDADPHRVAFYLNVARTEPTKLTTSLRRQRDFWHQQYRQLVADLIHAPSTVALSNRSVSPRLLVHTVIGSAAICLASLEATRPTTSRSR